MDNLQPYKISLDFYIRKIITVNAKQLDSDSRVINITCTENGKKFFVDSSTTSAFVRYKKSDGHSVLNQVDILEDGTVNLELSQQMLAVEGRQLVDIMLINKSELDVFIENISVTDDGEGNVFILDYQTENTTNMNVEEILTAISENGIEVLSTMSFYINTEGVAIDGSKIESSYEYNALVEGLGKMVAVDQRMTTLENTVSENEEERKKNETSRQTNETSRQNAESQRKQTFDSLVKNANTATIKANNAANSANDASNRANQASDEVDELIAKYESIEDFSKIDEILNYKVEKTQAEYDALSDEEKNNGKIYFITDANMGGTASEVSFDNTTSDLTSPNVQRAINEVNDKVNELSEKTKDNTDVIEEKVDKNSVVNNLTTTEEGFVLDARQGKILKDEINVLSPQFAYMWLSTSSVVKGTHVPYNQHVIVGDAFSFSGGKITLESDDVSYVRVSATIGGNASNDRCWMRIYRERDGVGTTIGDAIAYGEFFSPSCTCICQCKKGDRFYVYIAEETNVKGGDVGCYFTIEKLC